MAIFDAVADKVVEEKIKSCLFPVGAIYLSTVDVNPSTFLCGEWERFGVGKTLIGVDESDTDFNAPEKTGGEKTHTLTVNEMPTHSHIFKPNNQTSQTTRGNYIESGTANIYSPSYSFTTETAGGSQAHNNLQPYITCYMWKRIA